MSRRPRVVQPQDDVPLEPPVQHSWAICSSKLLEDGAGLLTTTFNELIPPEAQVHLWNAQRELLLAMAATIEHHSRRGEASAARARSAGQRRVRRVEVD